MARKHRRSSKEIRALNKIDDILENYNKGMEISTEPLKVEIKAKNTQKEPLPFSNTYMSDHACDMAEERFGIKRSEAQKHFRKKLRESRLIGLQRAEDGNEAYLYAIGRNAIYVSPDLKTIVSVNRYENVTYEPLKSKIALMHELEIRKLDRLEKSKTKKLELAKLEAKATISNLELRIYKTKSEAIRMSCVAHKNAIEIHIRELEDELNNIISCKRRVCKSMVAVV